MEGRERPVGGRPEGARRPILGGNTSEVTPESNLEAMARFGENAHRSGGPDRSVEGGSGREDREGRSEAREAREDVRDRGAERGADRGTGSGEVRGSRESRDGGGRQENNSVNRGGGNSTSNGGRGSGNGGGNRPPSGGAGSGRGNGAGSGKVKGGKIKQSLVTWVPWAFLIMLLLVGGWNTFKVPFVYDRSATESFNLFVFQIDNSSTFPFGQVESGIEAFDKNRVDPDMVYEMGIPRYYIYVYNGAEERNWDFVEAVEEYEKLGDVPIFKIEAFDAEQKGLIEFSAGSPQIVEMTRINKETSSVVTRNYYDVNDWKEEWVDNRDEKKWYEVFK